ncbi:MAG: hypothetical protein P8173_17950 [Gammaproteobacteria bacterium]
MSPESDVEAIERRRQDRISAVNARNVHLLTEDVVWIPLSQLVLTGHTAFRAWV